MKFYPPVFGYKPSFDCNKGDKSNFTLGELASMGILETLSEFLDENSLSTDSGEKKSKRVRFLCDNENPCKIAHTTWK